MAQIIRGRFTADMQEPFVIFLIGMRVNRLRAVRKWVGTFMVMPALLKELTQHPEKGLLGMEYFVYWRGIALVQYWRSFEHLEKFARNREDPHAAAWQRFMKNVGGDGTVGIFHETYVVPAASRETVYAQMPPYGLGRATGVVPIGRRGYSAGHRLDPSRADAPL